MLEKSLVVVLGLAIGSFLNVVIYRYPRGMSVIKPLRSFCPNCGAYIKWYHNIPIFSYFFLGGKCAECKAPIPMFYLLVEVLTPLCLLLLYIKFGSSYGWLTFIGFAVFVCGLIVTSFIDLASLEIPDFVSLGLIIFGWLFSFLGLNPIVSFKDSLISALSGVGLMFLINELFYHVTGKDGIGMGDFKLMGAIGAFIGYRFFYFVLLGASLFGIIAYFLAIGISGKTVKECSLKDKIPFGPFLSLSSYIVLIEHTIFEKINRFLFYWF